MQIFLNSKEIDFKIENEKHMGEIFDSMRKWLSENGFCIESAAVDNIKAGSELSEELRDKEIESTEKLEIEAFSILELQYARYSTIKNYFEAVAKAAAEKDYALLSELAEEYENLKPAVSLTIDFIGIESDGKENDQLGALIKNADKTEDHEKLKERALAIAGICEKRIRELTSPEEELEILRKNMGEIIEEAENISILLQTGKDTQAMAYVLHFIEFSKKMIRIASYLSFTKNRTIDKEKINEFNSSLNELCQAFVSSDSILIGDLFEYELAPKLQYLINQF